MVRRLVQFAPLLFVFLVAALAARPCSAQDGGGPAAHRADGFPTPTATVVRDAAGRVTVRATRISEPVAIDGALDDDVYARVEAIGGFLQQEPHEGEPATQQTDVWLLYDDRNVYVAARCWTTDPGRIVANEMRRDSFAIFQNDNFGVLFDTFHDRRNGLMFYTNPLGGLSDSLVTDERDTNRDWNTVWEVKTRRFEQGWTVEMAIPFRSLRYPASGPQDWGVQFRRISRGANEFSYLTPMPASFTQRAMMRVSQAAALVGLEAPKAALNLELKPYALGGVESDLAATVPYANDPSAAAGLDAKYTLRNGLVADATVNTDFAQVEDDEQQVNLTRFSLFFPERRDFFLEGAGIFAFGGASVNPRGGGGRPSSTPILFYSRRIGLFEDAEGETASVPLLAGGRLTGRTGAYTVGALNIQQRADASVGAPSTNFSVVRLKRDILTQSSVGAIFTSRSQAVAAGGSNQTLGADASFTVLRDLTLNAYLARTRTEGKAGNDASYRGDVQWMGDRYGFEAEHLTVERNFNPEVGFLRREDFRRNFGMFRFSPRPAGASRIRKYQFETSFDHVADTGGRLETQLAEARAGMDLQNGDEWRVEFRNSYEYLDEPFEIADGIVLPVGQYRFNEAEARYSIGPQHRISGSVWAGAGQFYGGTRQEVGYRGRVEVTSRLGIEPGVSLNWVDLAEGAFTAQLLSARATFNLSPRKALMALVQYNSAGDLIGANVRFRWEFRPGSDLFVVYNEGRDTALGVRRSEPSSRSFVVKVTRLVRF
ncbi:MAG: DUF5916 domain-containing protein [Vicinamibacterales bacterium]